MKNKKDLFVKWIRIMFVVQCLSLVVTCLSNLPLVGALFDWINYGITIVSLYVLYQLIPVHERFQKAVIFGGIGCFLAIIIKVAEAGILLGLAAGICNLIALYHEFKGYADVLLTIDKSLSGKWHSLFNWNIFGGIIVGILGTPILVAAAVAFLLDANVISVLTAILVGGFNLILQIVYVVYLKRTHDVCEKYEHWNAEIPIDEI